jgi:thiol:disulfide interchange protein DsbC
MNLPDSPLRKAGVAARNLLVLGSILLGAPHTVSADTIPDAVTRAVADLIPGLMPDSVAVTPIPGLYLAAFGAQVVYVSADGRYLLAGDLIELNSGRNLAEDVRSVIRKELIYGLEESGMVVFSPTRIRSTITVFTDVSCAYCVKLHQEINALTKAGVQVRYLGYPRAGIPSSAYDTLVSVWCAGDPQQAMTDAKAGRQIDKMVCETPIRDHMDVAEQIGVRGTPTVVLQNGQVLPGYVPAAELVERANTAANAGG